MRVVVIGAGIVGSCCALALADAGCSVTLVDPEEAGGEQAASFGNGGWISPASVIPMSTPGLAARVPGLMADRDGPLTLRAAALPSLAPWLFRFVRAGATWAQVEATCAVLAELLRDAPQRHQQLAARLPSPTHESPAHGAWILPNGLIYAYPDQASWQAEAKVWALRRSLGVDWRVLDQAAVDVAEAAKTGLSPGAAPWMSSRYGVLVSVGAGAQCMDPGGYTHELAAMAERAGVRRVKARVLGFDRQAQRLRAVRGLAPDGSAVELPADRAVLAAGIASGPLATALGDVLPLASERGYHIVLPVDPAAQARWQATAPVMPSDGKMALTLMRDGLRVAGQVELSTPHAPPDWRRADVLWRHAARMLSDEFWHSTPWAAQRTQTQCPRGVRRWMGHRPSSADGLPYVGPSAVCPDVIHAFGHGHIGLASAPITADWVREAVLGQEPSSPAARACQPSRMMRR